MRMDERCVCVINRSDDLTHTRKTEKPFDAAAFDSTFFSPFHIRSFLFEFLFFLFILLLLLLLLNFFFFYFSLINSSLSEIDGRLRDAAAFRPCFPSKWVWIIESMFYISVCVGAIYWFHLMSFFHRVNATKCSWHNVDFIDLLFIF